MARATANFHTANMEPQRTTVLQLSHPWDEHFQQEEMPSRPQSSHDSTNDAGTQWSRWQERLRLVHGDPRGS